jgi:hypothetical protein
VVLSSEDTREAISDTKWNKVFMSWGSCGPVERIGTVLSVRSGLTRGGSLVSIAEECSSNLLILLRAPSHFWKEVWHGDSGKWRQPLLNPRHQYQA